MRPCASDKNNKTEAIASQQSPNAAPERKRGAAADVDLLFLSFDLDRICRDCDNRPHLPPVLQQ